jgi:hypothetical protein
VKKTRLWLSSLLAVMSASASLLGGCSRAHLSSNYAQAYSAWFTAQRVSAKPANGEETRRIIESLDAGEAGAVSRNYRKGVSRGDESGVSRLLTIGAPRGAAADAYMPPASVPQ